MASGMMRVPSAALILTIESTDLEGKSAPIGRVRHQSRTRRYRVETRGVPRGLDSAWTKTPCQRERERPRDPHVASPKNSSQPPNRRPAGKQSLLSWYVPQPTCATRWAGGAVLPALGAQCRGSAGAL